MSQSQMQELFKKSTKQQLEIKYLKEEIEKNKQTIDEFQNKNKKQVYQIVQANSSIKKYIEEINKLKGQISQKNGSQIVQKKEDSNPYQCLVCQNIQKQIQNIRGEMKIMEQNHKSECKKLDGIKKVVEQENLNMKTEFQKLKQVKEEDIKLLNQQINLLNSKTISLMEQKTKLTNKWNQVNEEKKKLEQNTKDTIDKNQKLTEEKAQLLQNINDLTVKINAFIEKESKVQQTIKQFTLKNEELVKICSKSEKTLEEQTKKFKTIMQQNAKLIQQNLKTKEQLKQIKSQLVEQKKTNTELIETSKNLQNKNNEIFKVLKEKIQMIDDTNTAYNVSMVKSLKLTQEKAALQSKINQLTLKNLELQKLINNANVKQKQEPKQPEKQAKIKQQIKVNAEPTQKLENTKQQAAPQNNQAQKKEKEIEKKEEKQKEVKKQEQTAGITDPFIKWVAGGNEKFQKLCESERAQLAKCNQNLQKKKNESALLQKDEKAKVVEIIQKNAFSKKSKKTEIPIQHVIIKTEKSTYYQVSPADIILKKKMSFFTPFHVYSQQPVSEHEFTINFIRLQGDPIFVGLIKKSNRYSQGVVLQDNTMGFYTGKKSTNSIWDGSELLPVDTGKIEQNGECLTMRVMTKMQKVQWYKGKGETKVKIAERSMVEGFTSQPLYVFVYMNDGESFKFQ